MSKRLLQPNSACDPVVSQHLYRCMSTDGRTRYEKEQLAKSNSIGRLVLLGIALGVVGTIIRIKIMAKNRPLPKNPAQKK